MKKNSFSIIIPVYNSEKYLEACISSIINQNYQNFELILVDDGSTDNSDSILKKYSKLDERVKTVYKENGGVSSARNTGIDTSKNDYIIFVDSDDILEKNTLDYYNKLVNENIGVDFFQTKLENFETSIPKIDNDKVEEKILTNQERKKAINKLLIGDTRYVDFKIFPGPVCKIYKKNIIEENRIRFRKEFFMYEDGIFNLEYMLKCKSLCFSNCITYFYRTNLESITHKYNPNYTSQRLLMIKYVKKIIEENSIDIKYFYMFIHQSIIDIMSFNIFSKKVNLSNLDRKKMFDALYKNKDIKESLRFRYINNMILKKRLLILIFKYRGFNLLNIIYSIFK